MKAELFISWRYLWGRRSERFVSLLSVISILGVAIGVAALIIVLAVMSGFDKDLKEKIIGNYSHIVVEAPFPITGYDEILKKITNFSDVVGVSPFIQTQALMQHKNVARGVVVRGIDLKQEATVTDINRYLTEGDKEIGIGIFIGKELSYSLGLYLGDEVSLVNSQGKKNVLAVKGLFNSGMYDYDSNVIFMDLAKAQEIFDLKNAVHGISVKIDKLFLADSLKHKIQAAVGPDFYVRTWIERNRNFFAALKLEKITMFIILTLIVLVAAFNIISTLVVMVTEKTKDIGILKAIGMNSFRIWAIFTFEGLLIGILGILLGAGGGIFLCSLLKEYQFIKLPADIYYLNKLPVSLVFWPDVCMVILSALCISLVSAIYPAKKAADLNTATALRYE